MKVQAKEVYIQAWTLTMMKKVMQVNVLVVGGSKAEKDYQKDKSKEISVLNSIFFKKCSTISLIAGKNNSLIQ
jgi:hypothetical protein